MRLRTLLAATMVAWSGLAAAETREEWVQLGTRIHGFFGGFIPVGIRIGLDAAERLHAGRRDLVVTYHVGPKAPCPCIADGIMLATGASPGQGTLVIASDKAPEDMLAAVDIRNRKTGAGLHYTVAASWLPKLLDWNKAFDAPGRYDAAMAAPELFTVTEDDTRPTAAK
jgi:hypothetical protein